MEEEPLPPELGKAAAFDDMQCTSSQPLHHGVTNSVADARQDNSEVQVRRNVLDQKLSACVGSAKSDAPVHLDCDMLRECRALQLFSILEGVLLI